MVGKINKIYCDALIIGCGPAGLSAAAKLSEKNFKVLCIEKKKEIGKPVQCAEGIGSYLIKRLPFKIPKKLLEWKINGLTFNVDGIKIIRDQKEWAGYSINRLKVDKWLAKRAVKKGAKILTNVKINSIKLKGKKIIKVIIKVKKKLIEVFPKKVIIASGINSFILKKLGIYHEKKFSLMNVFAVEMKNIKLKDERFEQFYFCSLMPNAFFFIFPKSKNKANVGIGAFENNKKTKELFKKFIKNSTLKKMFSKAKIVSNKSKKAVFEGFTNKWFYGNTLLVGDAANQNIKPFIEGYLPAIICGNIAGEILFTKKISKYKLLVKKKIPEIWLSKHFIKNLKLLFKSKNKKKHLIIAAYVSNSINEKELKKILKGKDFIESKIMKK